MKYKLIILISILIILTLYNLLSRANEHESFIISPGNIQFKDTLNEIVTDSFAHNFGTVTKLPNSLVKYFEYIGTDSLFITRTWTSDPHYICKSPRGYLIPNKIYSITVCFAQPYRKVRFTKVMGFDLSNGSKIMFSFSGNVIHQN